MRSIVLFFTFFQLNFFFRENRHFFSKTVFRFFKFVIGQPRSYTRGKNFCGLLYFRFLARAAAVRAAADTLRQASAPCRRTTARRRSRLEAALAIRSARLA